MSSLVASVRGPIAATRVNTTNGMVDSNIGFINPAIVNGIGDISLLFDNSSKALVQGECNVQLSCASVVARTVVYDPLPDQTSGIRVRVFDVAGNPIDSFVDVVIWKVRSGQFS